MRQTLAYGAAIQQGKWPVLEDGFFADPQCRTFVIADGFGGPGRGDLAAKTALKEIASRLTKGAGPAVQRSALADVNKIILDWNAGRAPALRGGASALAVQITAGGQVTATNCGATAMALVRAGAVHVLLSPQAGPRSQPGSPLFADQALGLATEISPEARSFRALPGDLLLLVTSGLEWENSAFQSELLAQWGVHMPGSNMADLAAGLLRAVSPEWNSCLLAIEIP